MSYEFGAFEKPVIDYQTAQNQAQQRCAAWGYNSAEMFGGQKQDCIVRDGYGNCIRMRATITYQCTSNTAPAAVQ